MLLLVISSADYYQMWFLTLFWYVWLLSSFVIVTILWYNSQLNVSAAALFIAVEFVWLHAWCPSVHLV
jgi:hypothetical protein